MTAAIVTRAAEDFSHWLNRIDAALGLQDTERAYAVLRGVLHQLRDRINSGEAIHLGAQLPTLVRGVYFEGFTLREQPETERHLDGFLVRVAERMKRDDIDPERATRAVFALLEEKLERGELAKVIHNLPGELKALWSRENA